MATEGAGGPAGFDQRSATNGKRAYLLARSGESGGRRLGTAQGSELVVVVLVFIDEHRLFGHDDDPVDRAVVAELHRADDPGGVDGFVELEVFGDVAGAGEIGEHRAQRAGQ